MFNEMLRKYSHQYHHKLKKILTPLEDNLYVRHFGYYKITNEGRHHFIGSNLHYTDYYYSEKLYLNCPYLLHPSNYHTSMSLSKIVKDPEFQDQQDKTHQLFGINIGLTILERTKEGVEGFCFASNPHGSYSETLYINELPLLKHFIRGFKDEFQNIILAMESDSFDLSKVDNHDFHAKVELVGQVKNRDDLLKQLGIAVPFRLTKAEKEIAKLIAQGHTAKEIGELQYRSKRTIEGYIEVLKETLYCSSKSELTLKAQELAKLGYFS